MSNKPWAVEGPMFVCTTCHNGQPPYSRKEGADCIHCDGKVTEVITLDEAGEWKERAKEAEGKLYPVKGEHLEAKVAKLEAENKTLGEANKWLTYGIGAWCHKADMAKVGIKTKVGKLIEQYEGAAESMRKGQAHPHVPGIWDGVVKDLKSLEGMEV